MLLPPLFALTLLGAAQTAPVPVEPAPSLIDGTNAFVATERANYFSLSLDGALDLSANGLWPMGSGRLDLRYRMPLGASLMGEAGLRGGYGYRGFKGAVSDASYGQDDAAYLSAHAIPVYAVAALALGTGDESPLFIIPLRLSAYGGIGAHVVFGEAHGFGRTESLLSVAPATLIGASLELIQTPSFRYGLFSEWETSRLEHRVPGLTQDLSCARFGVTLSFSLGS